MSTKQEINRNKAHCEQVLRYLMAGNSVSAREAQDLFDCWHVASRIHDLRKRHAPRWNEFAKMIDPEHRDHDLEHQIVRWKETPTNAAGERSGNDYAVYSFQRRGKPVAATQERGENRGPTLFEV